MTGGDVRIVLWVIAGLSAASALILLANPCRDRYARLRIAVLVLDAAVLAAAMIFLVRR